MKRKCAFVIFLAVLAIVFMTFTSCGNTSKNDTEESSQYVVTFDSNGGSEVPSQKVTPNKRIKEPEKPKKEGYIFDGWYAGSEKWVFLSHTVDDDITLVAKWIPNDNLLVFDANGGNGTMENMYIIAEEKMSLLQNEFIRQGYTFAGWSSSIDGSVEYLDCSDFTPKTNNTYILYAMWSPIEYIITYNEQKETENVFDQVIFTIEDLPVTLRDLANKSEDCVFDGWYRDCNFSGLPLTEITEVGDIQLYANYVNRTNGLMFLEENGQWIIYRYKGEATDVVIPKKYKGKEVTKIDADAFWDINGNISLTSIEIPETVTSIGTWAFQGCTSLTSVNYLGTIENWCNISFSDHSANPLSYAEKLYINGELVEEIVIPSTFTKIKDYAFLGCNSLTSVTIPDSVTSIGGYAFSGCSSLTSVTIGNSVTSIGNNAFYNCDSLTSITIPDSVTSIGDYAFSNCDSLTSVTIPNSVINIGIDAFCNCTQLKYIVVDKNNLYYKSVGAVLYDKEGTTLISYPAGRSDANFIIPDGVTCVADNAFYNCTSLIGVTIENSVTSIGRCSFAYCNSLTSVTIPDSVTSIGDYAFSNCDSLTIYCEATNKPSGWSSIWNYSNSPVVWGHTHSYTDGKCICGMKEN